MKRIAMLILIILFCVSSIGCEKKTTIVIPFDTASVNNIEMYRYVTPDSAEKKVITEKDDITELYTMFSELQVSRKKVEPITGEKVIRFRFNLLDDTSYEIIYCAEGVKSGILKIPMEQLDYFTSADIGGYWKNCPYEVVAVNGSELPSYK